VSQTDVAMPPTSQSASEMVLARRISAVREIICRDRAIIVVVTNVLLFEAFLVDMAYTPTMYLLNYRTLLPVGAVGIVLAFTLSYWFRMREGLYQTELEQRAIAMEPDATSRQLLTQERLPYWMESTERERDGNVMLAILGSMAVVIASAYAGITVSYATGYSALIVLLIVPVPVVWILAFFMRRKAVMVLEGEVSNISQNICLPEAVGGAAGTPPEPTTSRAEEKNDPTLQFGALRKTVENAQSMFLRESTRLMAILVIFSAGVLAVALATILSEMQGELFPLGDYIPPLAVLAGLLPAFLHCRTRLAGNHPPSTAVEPGNLGMQSSAVPMPALVISEVSTSSRLMAGSRRIAEGSLILAVYGAAWLEVVMFLSASSWAGNVGIGQVYCQGVEMTCLSSLPIDSLAAWSFFLILLVPALALFLFLPYWFVGAGHRLREETSIRSFIHGLTMLEREFWARF